MHRHGRSARLAKHEAAGVDLELLQRFFAGREAYKRVALDGYLRDGLHITDDELARFRARVLEE